MAACLAGVHVGGSQGWSVRHDGGYTALEQGQRLPMCAGRCCCLAHRQPVCPQRLLLLAWVQLNGRAAQQLCRGVHVMQQLARESKKESYGAPARHIP
jgi:hypothetical protein